MPVPGPRNQYGPDGGYRNPDGEQTDRFNHWNRPGPIWWPGRTPGFMQISLRGCVLGFGQIRRMYRQSVNLIPAQGAFSWSDNGNDQSAGPPVGVTRALRYMTRSLYMGAGIDNTRYDGLHTQIIKQNTYKTVTVGAGNSRSRPTVRNRMTSFGSRVPTLNQASSAAESQNPGGATQA
jgi:hypothetical protein